MFPSEYSSVLEEMASQGYIVFANVPTGFVSGVSFPDGRITRRYLRPDFALWNGDVKYMLDQVLNWSSTRGNMFFGRIDVERVGMFGHSAGASVTSMMVHSDPRIKAGLALDPGLLRAGDAGSPFLLLNAENAEYVRQHPNDPNVSLMIKERSDFYHASKPGFQVTLAGADHNSVTNMAVIRAFGRARNGDEFITVTRLFVRKFFGEFLLGKHSDVIRQGIPKCAITRVEFHNEFGAA
jgi:predicted dienelactone hydrolase